MLFAYWARPQWPLVQVVVKEQAFLEPLPALVVNKVLAQQWLKISLKHVDLHRVHLDLSQ